MELAAALPSFIYRDHGTIHDRIRNRRRRQAAVALIGALGIFMIACMVVGYLNAAAPISWGIGEEMGTGRHMVIDSRLALSARFKFVSVTQTGAEAGLAPGDVLDFSHWTLAERLAFAYPSWRNPPQIVQQRGNAYALRWARPSASDRDVDYSRTSDIVVRLLLLCSALLIIGYGHGQAAFAAGLYLAAAAIASSPVMTFAGLPTGVQTSCLVIASVARLAAYGARFAFAMALLHSRPHRAGVTLWLCFSILMLLLIVFNGGRVASILAGVIIVPYSSIALPVVQSLMQVYSLALFAAAAIRAPKSHSFVIRIIFYGTFITIFSYILQECLLLAEHTPPAWMGWYFNSALLGVGICYPWAIFARRIAGVDFVISRGFAYAVSIGMVVIVINFAESLIEQSASGWVAGAVLNYGLPLALGLSFNSLQTRVTFLLESLLDHDLLNVSQLAKSLKSQFTEAGCVDELAELAAGIAAPLHADAVVMYRVSSGLFCPVATRHAPLHGEADLAAIPGDDPALNAMLATRQPVRLRGLGSILGAGWLFPLLVFGRIVGALHCGPRLGGRGYDPAERAILEDLSRELAVSLVCVDPMLNVRKLLPADPIAAHD
ncbi:MAG: hypothetical protein WDN04_24640 [Rhodospirillales bacterium]